MAAILLTIHTLLVLGLVAVILLQRSEGGALGMGGGGGGGNFMSGRGAANVLTRTTVVLSGCFFATSIGLAMIGDRGETAEDVARRLTGEEATEEVAPPGTVNTDELFDLLGTGASDDDATDEPGEETLDLLAPADGEGEEETENDPQQ